METHLDMEEVAYTNGAHQRRFIAYLDNTELLVSGRCGIPDTYFTIPGHARVKGTYMRGYVTIIDERLVFVPYKGK